jgi:ferredoxin
MKTLILDAVTTTGMPPTVARLGSIIEDECRKADWGVRTIVVPEMDISPCMGCFQCWVRTPGICVIGDAGQSVAGAWMLSDVVVLVTPVTFGGYSAVLKRVLPSRDDESVALFSRIIERHATNAHSPWHRAFVLCSDQEYRGVGDIIGPMAALAQEAA